MKPIYGYTTVEHGGIQTIFARHRALNNTHDKKDEGGGYVCNRNTSMMIEHSWKHVLAIARNQMEEVNLANGPQQPRRQDSLTTSTTSHPQHQLLVEQLGQPNTNQFYDRERLMVQALDTLFSVACEGSGYLDFLATMVELLDPDCPVSMAFLSHVVDRSTLPSRGTMSCVSSALISTLDVRFFNSSPIIATTETTASPSSNEPDGGGSNGSSRWTSWIIHHVTTTQPSIQTTATQTNIHCEFGSKVDARVKRNALVIWAILAEKFAGDMVHLLWTPHVANLLFYFLSSNAEDWTVRVFALLALEKFALTGDMKTNILQHPLQIQNALRQAIYDSKYDRPYNTGSNIIPAAQTATATHKTSGIPGTTGFFHTLRKRPERPYMVDWISTYMHKLAKRKQTRQSKNNTLNNGSYLQHQHHQQQSNDIEPMDEDESTYGSDNDDDNLSHFTWTDPDRDANHKDSHDSWMGENLDYDQESTKSSLLLENASKHSVMERMELAHCAEWALGHIFNNNQAMKPYSTWDLSDLNVIVNPFDATQHWKIGSNGLELRNDRLYFESIRATTSVKKGRWYYEVLLVTEGIMQIGWCTNRCRFVPEEGYGVGDDQHGFAFDTYRCAVWANGSAVYPQPHNPLYKCRAGDVLGSYLDMDQGICSFFINGKDLGSTVAFEHASNQNRTNNMEGLFPAFSLTTHQHILINFGDQPWMYLPDHLLSHQDWKGINQADSMDSAFRQQVQCGGMIRSPLDKEGMAEIGHAKSSTGGHGDDDDDHINDDWDGPLCIMCFNEPKDTSLIPCGHGSWGAACTKVLVSCPLCRSKIEGYNRQPAQK